MTLVIVLFLTHVVALSRTDYAYRARPILAHTKNSLCSLVNIIILRIIYFQLCGHCLCFFAAGYLGFGRMEVFGLSCIIKEPLQTKSQQKTFVYFWITIEKWFFYSLVFSCVVDSICFVTTGETYFKSLVTLTADGLLFGRMYLGL